MPSPPVEIDNHVLATARQAALDAGRMAMQWFRAGEQTSAQVNFKNGGSPVTAADLAVDAFLKKTLGSAAPAFGWLSEETADDSSRLAAPATWVVDPIDGTRAFARGDADWTVAIGIVTGGRPVAGFVYAPVSDELFEVVPGEVARRNGEPLVANRRDALEDAVVAGPRPLLDRLAAQHPRVVTAPLIRSLALRIVRVADGTLDAGLAGDRAHDWDLAAAHAILAGSGATLLGMSGREPTYNRPTTVHEPLAAASSRLARDLVSRLAALHAR